MEWIPRFSWTIKRQSGLKSSMDVRYYPGRNGLLAVSARRWNQSQKAFKPHLDKKTEMLKSLSHEGERNEGRKACFKRKQDICTSAIVDRNRAITLAIIIIVVVVVAVVVQEVQNKSLDSLVVLIFFPPWSRFLSMTKWTLHRRSTMTERERESLFHLKSRSREKLSQDSHRNTSFQSKYHLTDFVQLLCDRNGFRNINHLRKEPQNTQSQATKTRAKTTWTNSLTSGGLSGLWRSTRKRTKRAPFVYSHSPHPSWTPFNNIEWARVISLSELWPWTSRKICFWPSRSVSKKEGSWILAVVCHFRDHWKSGPNLRNVLKNVNIEFMPWEVCQLG